MLTDKEKMMIQSFAKHNMRMKLACDELFYCRDTILYHFAKVHKKTGLNPRQFHDLAELIRLIEAEGASA